MTPAPPIPPDSARSDSSVAHRETPREGRRRRDSNVRARRERRLRRVSSRDVHRRQRASRRRRALRGPLSNRAGKRVERVAENIVERFATHLTGVRRGAKRVSRLRRRRGPRIAIHRQRRLGQRSRRGAKRSTTRAEHDARRRARRRANGRFGVRLEGRERGRDRAGNARRRVAKPTRVARRAKRGRRRR